MTRSRRVPPIVKPILLALFVACGAKHPATVPSSGSADRDPPGPVKDTRTEIERRRDAACEALGPRITACAVEDAKAQLAAGKVTKAQYAETTAPAVQKKNTEEFVKACRTPATPYSSRQIRVLEVCPKAESDCDPLLACLENLNQP